MRNFTIKESIPVDLIWEDNIFGVYEGTTELVTPSNHTIYATLKLTVEILRNGREEVSFILEELFIEDPFGREIDYTDDEYDAILENLQTNIEW